MRQAPKKLNALLSITLLDHITFTIGYPVLTFLCYDLSSTIFDPNTSQSVRSFWYGVCNALPHTIAIFASPILAAMSDSFGRKRILFLGALGTFLLSISYAISIFTGSLTLLILGCIISGLCSQTQPIALAAVADISEPQRLTLNMSYLQFSISIGAFLGPLMGGYFAKRFFFDFLNFSTPFIIGCIASLAAIFFTKFFLTESLKIENKTASKIPFYKEIQTLLFNKKILHISILLISTQIAWRTYYQFIPPILKLKLNYDATTIGFFISLIAIWLCIASAFGIKILNTFITEAQIIRYSSYSMFIGLITTIIGIEMPNGTLSSILIWSSSSIIAMSDVIIFSIISSLYSSSVEKHQQGKIMGLCFIIVTSIWSITGFFGGLMASINLKLPLFLAPLSILIAILTAIRNPR